MTSPETTPMTPNQIALVRDSFAKLTPNHEAVAARFYEKLFEIDPSTRPMFRGDLKAQGVKLFVALSTVVRALDNLAPVLETVRELGRRHVRYGVEERHYGSVGLALLATLQEGFGPAFDTDLHIAWATAYGAIAGAMIDAASSVTAQAA
jgi:hemoglobin-like flavoprotein